MAADQFGSGVSQRRVVVGGAIAGLAGPLGFSATTVCAAFIALGIDTAYVPAPFFSAETRDQWVLKV